MLVVVDMFHAVAGLALALGTVAKLHLWIADVCDAADGALVAVFRPLFG